MLSHGVIVGPLHQPPLAAYKLEDSLQWVHSFRHHMYHLTSFKLTCSGIFSNNFCTTWELHFFDLPTPISLHFQFLLLLLTCSILLSFCLYCNLWQTSDSDYSHPQPWLIHGPNSPALLHLHLPGVTSYLGKLHITWKGFNENSWPQAPQLEPSTLPHGSATFSKMFPTFQLFLKFLHPLLFASLSLSLQPWLPSYWMDGKSLIFPSPKLHAYLSLHPVTRGRHGCCFSRASSFLYDLHHLPTPACSRLLFLQLLCLSALHRLFLLCYWLIPTGTQTSYFVAHL